MYFNDKKIISKNKDILKRKKRVSMLGFKKTFRFEVGDVISVALKYANSAFMFEGICISIKFKNFNSPNVSVILRSVLENVGVEFTFSYFYNRAFFFKFLDYKRKRFNYVKSKLFYLRKFSKAESHIV